MNRVTCHAEDTALAKTGNPFLRYYLIEAANSVRQHCPEYRDSYNDKLAQSPKHAHKRALVLTARKFVRLVDARLAGGHRLPTTRNASRPEGGPHSTAWGAPPATSAHTVDAEYALPFLAHPRAQEHPTALQAGSFSLPFSLVATSWKTSLTLHRRSDTLLR